MSLRPVPLTKDELGGFLETMAAAVRADDSFEGFIEYLLPDPPFVVCVSCGNTVGIGGPEMEWCPDPCNTDLRDSNNWKRVEDELPADTYAMVKASVRFGNSMGQGGVSMIGDVVNTPPTDVEALEAAVRRALDLIAKGNPVGAVHLLRAVST